MSEPTLDRRDLLRLGAASTAALAGFPGLVRARPRRPVPAGLEEATIAGLQEQMASGALTARALTEAYAERIDFLDRRGPAINCVLQTNSEALATADMLDKERQKGRVRGPLHGIPVLLKDNIATATGMLTTAGSLALVGAQPPFDAYLTRRLLQAGAIILGKTNLSEWANFRSRHSTSGWSGKGGLCRNPYALDRNTSGSSSGTAGAIAANLAAVGLGTETDGSIVSPSSCCGLVGVKPTVGLVSRVGIVPIAESQDTAGPMARSVADAAALLTIVAGTDPQDPATAEADRRRAPDYTAFLQPDGLRGARLGVVRQGLFGYNPHTDRIGEEALDALRRAGAELIDPVDIPTLKELDGPELEVLLYEFKAGLNAYLFRVGAGASVKTLAEVIAFNERQRDRELVWFGQDLLVAAEAKGPLTEPAYLKARADCVRLARTEGIDAAMDQHRLDALVAPTGEPAWLTDLVNGDTFRGGSSTLAAVAGYPHVTVPAGMVHGLPVGFSFFGRAWSEPVLIRLAYGFEQATKARRSPGFAPTAPIPMGFR